MFVFTLGALAFSGFLGWLLYNNVQSEPPATIQDWAIDLTVGAGILCVTATSIKALVS